MLLRAIHFACGPQAKRVIVWCFWACLQAVFRHVCGRTFAWQKKKKKMWSLFENVIRRSKLLLHLVYCTPRNRTISIFHGQHCFICTLHVFCYLPHPCLLEGSFTGGCRVTYEPVSLALFTGPSFHSADFIILAIVKELCLYMQPLLSVLLYFHSCN